MSAMKMSDSSSSPDSPENIPIQHHTRKRSVSMAEDQLRKSLGPFATRRSSDGFLSLAPSRLHKIYNSGGFNKKVKIIFSTNYDPVFRDLENQ